MRKYFFLLLLFIFICGNTYSTGLVETKKLYSYTKSELISLFKQNNIPQVFLPIHNGVSIHEVTYYTQWKDGSKIKATGVVFIPDNLKPGFSTMVYHNGTRFNKQRDEKIGRNQFAINAGFAGDGYVVIVPDYIGMGNGDKYHLYLNAKSESQASVDMILATKQMFIQEKLPAINEVFLTGYSQGGHAAMATQQLIEKSYLHEINLIASAPMSGAYDLSGTVKVEPNTETSAPMVFIYLIKSFYDSYDLRSSLSEVFVSPYDTLVSKYLYGSNDYRKIHTYLPTKLVTVFQKDFVVNELLNKSSKFYSKIKENNVFEFVPKKPTQLCYCESDDVVPYTNSITAFNYFTDHGAKDVFIKHAGTNMDHDQCAVIAFVYTKFFFDSYRKDKKNTFKNELSDMTMSIALAVKKVFPKIELF